MQNYLLYDPSSAAFIGFGNFVAIMQDEVFWISLWNSLIWIVGVVGLQFLLGLGAALAAQPELLVAGARARARHHSLGAAERHHRPDVDVDVRLQSRRHQRPPDPPGHDRRALRLARAARTRRLPAIMLALIWQGFPFFAVTILAGLQTVPAELYEAAEIDGATPSAAAVSRDAALASPASSRRPSCCAPSGSPIRST